MNELINPQNLALSTEQYQRLMPYFILTIGSLVSLLTCVLNTSKDPIRNRKNRCLSSFLVALATIGLSVLSVANIWGESESILLNGMLASDYYSNLMNVVLMGTAGFAILSSWSYLEQEKIHHAEYYTLILLSCLGMMVLASALDLIVLFVSLEIMSIAVYVLVGFRRTDVRSNEAAIKYFILGGAASAVLLYGSALVYGATGTMNLTNILEWTKTGNASNPIFILGVVLVLSGQLFKVAAVPFHMWMPDIYEGAPISVTSYMTTGLKAAVFAIFLRVFVGFGSHQMADSVMQVAIHNVLWVIALLTMLIGNIIALTQTNLKRMLAYSSIAHSGYILIGFISGAKSEQGYAAVLTYLIGYIFMNMGAFAILSILSEQNDKFTDVEDFSGLGFKYPVLGIAMTVFMFSMAGVPPTIGFMGKYLIFSSAVQAGEIWLAVLGVLCSAISAYFYLRVIVYMYMKEPLRNKTIQFATPTIIVIVATTFGALQFGLFPSLVIQAAKKAAMNM